MALNATPGWALDRTATTYIRVNVLDTNDNSPEFIDTYGDLVVPSDLPRGSYVTTLRARDADEGNNALLQYSLFGSEADKLCFDCDLATGVVRISSECEALQPGRTHSLTAWVRDLGTPEPKQTSTEFKVTILGLRVNAYPPRFDAPSGLYQGRLREGAPIGSRVIQLDGVQPLRICATDPEGLPVVYMTVGGSGLGAFTVTPDGASLHYFFVEWIPLLFILVSFFSIIWFICSVDGLNYENRADEYPYNGLPLFPWCYHCGPQGWCSS